MQELTGTAEHYEQLIEDGMRLQLSGSIRTGVLERLKLDDAYTDEQFAYWMDCLASAAKCAATDAVASGVYRDIAKIYFSHGDNDNGLEYCQQALTACPTTLFRSYIEDLIAEHTK